MDSIEIATESTTLLKFTAQCPTCSEPYKSGPYVVRGEGGAIKILFNCPTDGAWTESGTLSFSWTPDP